MKRILINATHNEEVRVALCNGNHLYDFDLENRTREQKKANIYKGHVTRVEPSLEAVFVEYGSKRQGFLPIREIAPEYLSGKLRDENIRKLIKEGDELIVQVEKEERGNKGAALSTYVSLAGRYLVLMPNNPKGGGISRQISGKLREDMKRMLGNLDLPKGMSIIIRTAGIGKTQEDLQHDLNHLLNIWNAIQDQNKKYASPRLVHQEAGVVTRAVRDYLRDDISEIWIDNEDAFIEAETFIKAVMPKQIDKLRKYTDFEPMFTSFNVERQIETAYQREVRLPSGGSIVIDQTEALVSIDINSAKSTKGADVSETAYHTNLEAADEIARQLRLRDMGGLVVIDFIDMNDNKHQKDVEKRLIDATKYDRARVQFSEISRFGLMEMSRQRLRPSLEESTGYLCPRCNGNGMIRDLRSLSLSIMRQIEQTALKERHGEIQAEVPTDIAAFLLNEKRESLVYLEQDSGTRITILPHAHLESPNFNLHFNHQGFAPSSYERITDTQEQEANDRGYEVNWQTAESERPAQQPTRQPRSSEGGATKTTNQKVATTNASAPVNSATNNAPVQAEVEKNNATAVAWLSNLFAPTPEAKKATSVSSADAAQAIESIVNSGAQSRGAFGNVSAPLVPTTASESSKSADKKSDEDKDSLEKDSERRRNRNNKARNRHDKKADRNKNENRRSRAEDDSGSSDDDPKSRSSQRQEGSNNGQKDLPKRGSNSRRDSRGPIERGEAKKLPQEAKSSKETNDVPNTDAQNKRHSSNQQPKPEHNRKPSQNRAKNRSSNEREVDPNEVTLNVTEAKPTHKKTEVVHISLDDSKTTTKTVSVSSEAESTEKLVNNSASSVQASSVQASSVKDDKTPSIDNTKAQSAKPSTTEASAEDYPVAMKKAENVKSKKAVTGSDSEKKSVSTPTEVEATKTKSTESKAVISNDDSVDKASNVATMTFNTDSLFADRYVTAHKFGKASNDPRVIKNKMNGGANKQDDTKPTNATANKTGAIKGTVGEFINTHLAQAKARLHKDGVINCFLAALNAHAETSGIKKSNSATSNKKAPKNVQSFSFVNYGYEPLSEHYLERFAEITSAVKAYDTDQGKTAVEPKPIGARAKNDPRGQHPDYTPDVADFASQPQPEPASFDNTLYNGSTQSNDVRAEVRAKESSSAKSGNVASSMSQTEKSPAQAMSKLFQLSAGSLIERVLGQDGLDMINSGNTEIAFLKALRQPIDVLISVASTIDSSTQSKQTTATNSSETQIIDENQFASALTSAEQVEEVSEHSAEIIEHGSDQNVANTVNSEAKEESNEAESTASTSNSGSNKTSIESYKSMIETISEQLLPQTGLLNLSTPKVPKSRTRKDKEESESSNKTDSNDK